jgi:hypothetical protein
MKTNICQDLRFLGESLSYRNLDAPPKLMTGLFLYALGLCVGTHVLSLSRNGGDVLCREWWIIVIVCGLIVEIANQTTYYLARVNKPLAARIKALIFWTVFTAGMAVYVYLLLRVEAEPHIRWNQQLPHALVYLWLCRTLPPYSFSTDIRFLMLRGKFNPGR